MRGVERASSGDLQERLARLGEIGRQPEGGIHRLPFSAAESEAVALVRNWMEADGLAVRRDAAGNLFGRREGAEARAAAVLAGSHLDSVRGGGAYDGALGVLGALDAVRRLGPTRRPIEVAAFTNEEGNRFPGLFGSRAFAGVIDPAELGTVDQDGIRLDAAMVAAGLDPLGLSGCAADPARYAGFFELHIEQGRVLESAALQIGVVRSIVGLQQAAVGLTGRADHAGTTPMADRADAVRAAAAALATASEAADRLGPPAVLTCGRLTVRPGAPNVVAARVDLTLDMRDADAERLRRLADGARAAFTRACAQYAVTLRWEPRELAPPTAMDPGLAGLVAAAAARLGLSAREMSSGAGHDAMAVARVMPAAMIFVPCRGGRSHCPEEYASPEDCQNGADVLREAIARAAA